VDANETEIGTKSGSSDTRDAAMAAAKRAIDNALDPKKRKLLPPTWKPSSGFFQSLRRLWPSSRVLLRGRTVGYTEPVNLLSVAEKIHRIEYFGRRRVL
jgi:hypothetical protein